MSAHHRCEVIRLKKIYNLIYIVLHNINSKNLFFWGWFLSIQRWEAKLCLSDKEVMMQMWENGDNKRKRWEMRREKGHRGHTEWNAWCSLVDLQAQASCTTWLETATTHKNTTKTHLLDGFVSNAISNKKERNDGFKEENLGYWECTRGSPHSQTAEELSLTHSN